jgi:heat-inducible transcriptional repressor
MSDALTARQTQILKSLIDEYIEIAEPVGSENLEKKYNLGVSPATIRNEMVALTKSGYLRQPHTSAGRIPSPKAMKFYIDQLMEERQMSLADEVKAKENVFSAKDDVDEILNEATHALSNVTQSLTVAALDDDDRVWSAGYSHVFHNPEFTNMEDTMQLFSFLEEVQLMHELFFKRLTGSSPIEVIFGEELGWPGFRPVGVVASQFGIRGKKGALGVIGPTRLPYPRVIPAVRYFRDLIEEACR